MSRWASLGWRRRSLRRTPAAEAAADASNATVVLSAGVRAFASLRAYASASATARGARGGDRVVETRSSSPGGADRVDPLHPPPPASTFPAYAPRDFFRFELVHQSSKSAARVGRIHTPHGVIDTPAFVAVGTNGALKAVPHQALADAGVDMMFANTYHLTLQPGPDVVARAGGLHRFVGRDAPIITDSGGFQVFSLARPSEDDRKEMKSRRVTKHKDAAGLLLEVNESGVLFKSYRDGARVALTPESSVAAQKKLGADVIVPLDELPPYHISRDALERSVYLSHRWEARSLREHLRDVRDQAMYGVIHGGADESLRRLSAAYVGSLPFDGFAIGGSLGKDPREMAKVLGWVLPALPKDRPNHVLGIGDESSVRLAVPLGADAFDSTFPTRAARHGTLLTRTRGRVNVRRREFATTHQPPCAECECRLCREHTLAYLHHLDRAKEPMAWTLATEHNLRYMGALMRDQREAILRGEL
jgi:queuine tRNA-ribosyltransferase